MSSKWKASVPGTRAQQRKQDQKLKTKIPPNRNQIWNEGEYKHGPNEFEKATRRNAYVHREYRYLLHGRRNAKERENREKNGKT